MKKILVVLEKVKDYYSLHLKSFVLTIFFKNNYLKQFTRVLFLKIQDKINIPFSFKSVTNLINYIK